MSCQTKKVEGFCPSMAGECPGGVCPMRKLSPPSRDSFTINAILLIVCVIILTLVYRKKYSYV